MAPLAPPAVSVTVPPLTVPAARRMLPLLAVSAVLPVLPTLPPTTRLPAAALIRMSPLPVLPEIVAPLISLMSTLPLPAPVKTMASASVTIGARLPPIEPPI